MDGLGVYITCKYHVKITIYIIVYKKMTYESYIYTIFKSANA